MLDKVNRSQPSDPRAMRTRQLWAAWRDRAALARLKTPNVRIQPRR
jgi:hypothetical protein